MPEPKDIVIGILGACAALAGLLLVFAGYVFSEALSFPAGTDSKIIQKFKNAGAFGGWPFLISVADSLLAFAWLLWPSRCLFVLTAVGFAILLVFTAVYGAVVLWSYLSD